MINGKMVSQMGVLVDPTKDRILVQGQPLAEAGHKAYLLFHKPRGVLVTKSDDRGRKTIYDLLPPFYQSVDPAGRLDKESSGVLLLSSDGDFVHSVTHPKFHLPKQYRVTLTKPTKQRESISKRFLEGIPLDPENVLGKAISIQWESPECFQCTLITGYNRQIRRMVSAVGCDVKTLRRVSIGPIQLGDLAPGRFRKLTPREIRLLLKAATKSDRD
jgi:23S rRNA pseudouridine2605 synthase